MDLLIQALVLIIEILLTLSVFVFMGACIYGWDKLKHERNFK
jgi:hypothetical protein